MRILRSALAIGAVLALPVVAYAQASIAGVVRDTSGAVLPGVTVEAASPVLIEKVRSAVSDSTGHYRIVELRPGTYSVTFTLAGFNTVKREGIELTGSFTATIDADLRVGAIEETITVTSEAPTVDVQSTTKQRVLDHTIVDALPTARSAFALGALVPGMTAASTNGSLAQDVGGMTIRAQLGLAVHGGRQSDQAFTQNGIPTTAQAASGYTTVFTLNFGAIQEVSLDYSAVNAELPSGGVRINVIPREGGNTYRGTMLGSFANHALQGNNFTQDLKDRGLASPDSIKTNWDFNPGFGGPFAKDRVWFYGSARHYGANNYASGMYYNKNANNINAWTYDPDLSQPATNDSTFKGADGRLSWQATPKNKIGFSYAYQKNCNCLEAVSATRTPEAADRGWYPIQRRFGLDWSQPVTSRLLLEAGIIHHFGTSNRQPMTGLNPLMIAVTEQSSGLQFRALSPSNTFDWQFNRAIHERFAASYITGSHAVKVGFTHAHGLFFNHLIVSQPIAYRFNNGIPNQLTIFARPYELESDTDHGIGLFAQDAWTVKRLTVTYGARYDYYGNSFPEQHLGTTQLTPGRDVTFPAKSNLSWHDVTPKIGASYDLFGTRKTAIKVSLNKYLESVAAGHALALGPNPVNSVINNTTRSWTDANRDFVADCDLVNPAANGECGAMANANFGKPVSSTAYDPALLRGWGNRGFNWEFSAGVQHEIAPRISADISYFRRWYGNFVVTDNLTVAPADFDTFSLAVPADPRLPGGGGNLLAGLYDLKPAKFGQPASNYVTLAKNYGDQREHWNGVDVTVNARPRGGLLLQGGLSTGRTETNNCDVVTKLPETLLGAANIGIANANVWSPLAFCDQSSGFVTQMKMIGVYTVPKVNVQVSTAYQSLPGPAILANYNAPNTTIAPILGRNLAGNAANLTLNLVEPGALYGERLHQLDLRVGKILAFGRTRTLVSVDLFNALNADTVTTQNNNFGAWQRPTSILPARFAKLNVQFDF